MGVTDNLTGVAELLRGGKEVGVRVDKTSRLQIIDGHLDCKRLIDIKVLQVGGGRKFARGHLARARDGAHRCRVAGTALLLLTVGEITLRTIRFGEQQAKVDEIVRCSERGDLTSFGTVRTKTIGADTLLDDPRVESKGRLSVISSNKLKDPLIKR